MASIDALEQENTRLRQHILQLEQEKSDLEILLDAHISHADIVSEDLFEKLDASLRESEKRFRLITEAMPVPIVIYTVADQKVIYANKPANELVGVREGELLEKPVTNFISAIDWERAQAKFQQTGQLTNFEVKGKRIGGLFFYVGAYIVNISYGNAPCCLAAFLDLTAWKKMEEMKSKFITLASHELRTPLSILKGYLELTAYVEMKLPPQLRSIVPVTIEMVERLTTIVEKICSLANLSQLDRPLVMEKFILTDLVKAIAMEIDPFVRQRFLNFQLNLPQTEIKIRAHIDSIWQIFMNLLLNAIRFTPDKGTITLTVSDLDDHIEAIVTDTGIGISLEEHRRIFSSFYEVQNTNLHSSGTIQFGSGGIGMGLTIVKAALERHNGQIWVESAVGKGSTFHITLPKNMPDGV